MSNRFHVGGVLAAVALLATCLAWTPARADDAAELRALLDEVKAEREALKKEREDLAEQRKRVDEALSEIESAKASGRQIEAGEAPDSEEAPSEGPGPRLDVYGFAQLDAIYDFDRIDPDWNSTLRASKIPVNCPEDPGCGNGGETIFSVRQSRLGFRGFLPTRFGELRAQFEFDLFGVGDDAGQTTFRLRHAWGELGPVLAGQTWSLFMDPDVFPNEIDYWGPSGMVFLRNPQIRYTPGFLSNESWKVAIALENPSSGIDQGKLAPIDPNFDANSWNTYPDATAQVRYSGGWGHVQLAGILRGLGFEGTSTLAGDFRGRELGWGVNTSTVVNVGFLGRAVEQDQVLLQAVYGYGIANYMNDGGVDLAPSQPPPGSEGQAIPTFGWLAYYNRTWNDYFTSSFGYSEHRQDTSAGQMDSAMAAIQYATVNTLFHPVTDMFVGPEIQWGRRKNRSGDSDTDTRMQLSFKYNFGGTIFGGER